MNKEFDFDDIGKKTPYRTPDNFFEDMQQKVMERTYGRQRRKRRLQIMFSTAVAAAAILAGEAAAIRLINGFMNCRMRSWKSSSTSLIMTYF